MAIPPKEKQYFEQLGAARVREITSTLPAGFSSLRQVFALEWLAEIDEAEGVVRKAHQGRQTLAGRGAVPRPLVGIGVALGAVVFGLVAWLSRRW
jgi:hypothetical protein